MKGQVTNTRNRAGWARRRIARDIWQSKLPDTLRAARANAPAVRNGGLQ